MQLRLLPISSLQAAPYNPRKPLKRGDPGYRRLARSIEEFDLVQPIVWNERTGHIVAGHQRLEILKDRGETAVQCVVVDLPFVKEKALNVALNNVAVGSDWDDAKLQDLLSELVDTPGIDATLTGFDAQDLTDLLLAPAAMPMPTDDADESAKGVRVSLIVAADRWDEVRRDLDRLVANHDVEIHVKLPS